MFCAISGNVPEQPVISKKSGHLFERDLAEKYVKETGKCPITGEALELDDLVAVQTSKLVKPRSAPAASIPGLLGLFHDEWDALMLEAHQLRQSLHSCRQELSHALYQQDAASRVIARLLRERDEARAALDGVRESVRAELAQKRAAEVPPEEEEEGPAKRQKAGITEAILQELVDVNATLSKGRKKRQISPSLASAEEVAALTLLGSHPLHKTTQPGILSIDVNPEAEHILATAGADGTVQLFDHAQGRILGALEGHTKKVTSVRYVSSEVLVTASADKTSRIWRGSEGAYSSAAVCSEHFGEVVGASVHPSRHYFVTASQDKTWCFYDVQTGSCLQQVKQEGTAESYTCVQFHPDGLIVGTGTEEKIVRIWELRSMKNVASVQGHAGPVRALAFSENGFTLATAATDGVKIWDLRKLKQLKELQPYESAPCNAVTWDASGYYLAVGGADVSIYNSKQDWSVVKQFSDMPKKGVHSILTGKDCRRVYVGAADHNLRVYGEKA